MVYTAMRGRPRRLLTRYRTRTKRQRRRSVKASPHLCHGDRRPLRTVDVLRVSQSSSGVNRDDDAKDSVIWRHSAPFSERKCLLSASRRLNVLPHPWQTFACDLAVCKA